MTSASSSVRSPAQVAAQLAQEGVAQARFQRFLERTEKVAGWFYPQSAAIWDGFLEHQTRLGVLGDLLEIGVWEGKSAGMMALHARSGECCLLVDCDLKEKKIEQTMQRLAIMEGVVIQGLHMDSVNLWNTDLMQRSARSMRWIHIDGEHTGRAMRNDLELANKLLSDKGILVIDDFFSWLYPQITEAVMRYVREFPEQFALYLVGFNKAYLARPHFVHHYLDYCHHQLPAALALRGQVAMVSKTTYAAEMNTFGVGPRFQDVALRGPDWDQQTIPR